MNYGFTVNDNDDDDETEMFNGKYHVPGFYRPARDGIAKTKIMFSELRDNSISDKFMREFKLLLKIEEEAKRRISEFKLSFEEYDKLRLECNDFVNRCIYTMCHSELKVLKKYEKMCKYLIPILKNNKINKLYDKKGRVVKSGLKLIDEYLEDLK